MSYDNGMECKTSHSRLPPYQWGNLITAVVAVGSILIMLGQRDAGLTDVIATVRELQSVSIQLAKTQAAQLEGARHTEKTLEQIVGRLNELERKARGL